MRATLKLLAVLCSSGALDENVREIAQLGPGRSGTTFQFAAIRAALCASGRLADMRVHKLVLSDRNLRKARALSRRKDAKILVTHQTPAGDHRPCNAIGERDRSRCRDAFHVSQWRAGAGDARRAAEQELGLAPGSVLYARASAGLGLARRLGSEPRSTCRSRRILSFQEQLASCRGRPWRPGSISSGTSAA